MKKKRLCAICRFYDADDANAGACRRFPPPWVRVASGEWCGEYKANLGRPRLKEEPEAHGLEDHLSADERAELEGNDGR